MSVHVLLITTWGKACGIAEHSAMLKEHVELADPEITIRPCSQLDPEKLRPEDFESCDILHLNYQAALHSLWTPRQMYRFTEYGKKIVVTYHDTGVPNSDQCHDILGQAHAAVVHEPFDDLREETTRYWRMGVLGWHRPFRLFVPDERPIVGSIGFPFGWKNFTELCRVAASVGWGVQLIAPGATDEQIAEWMDVNPHVTVHTEFLKRSEAVETLMGCDATAFPYVTHNTGQSGAILLGIAARKPVIALETCRQFRALFDDTLARTTINWAADFDEIRFQLSHFIRLQRVDPGIVALAEQESWTKLGQKYAELYRSLVEG